MRIFIALLVVVMATSAMAQDENTLGLFFSDTEFTPETANIENTFAPIDMYLVLLNPTVASIGGYEVGIVHDAPSLFFLTVAGPNGWTNFGDSQNHLAGYQTPLPAGPPGVVLCTLTLLYPGADTVCFNLVPATPASIPDYPAIADGSNPDNLLPCNIFNYPDCTATINGAVANEGASYSEIKGLFR